MMAKRRRNNFRRPRTGRVSVSSEEIEEVVVEKDRRSQRKRRGRRESLSTGDDSKDVRRGSVDGIGVICHIEDVTDYSQVDSENSGDSSDSSQKDVVLVVDSKRTSMRLVDNKRISRIQSLGLAIDRNEIIKEEMNISETLLRAIKESKTDDPQLLQPRITRSRPREDTKRKKTSSAKSKKKISTAKQNKQEKLLLRTGNVAFIDKKIITDEYDMVKQISKISKNNGKNIKSLVVEFELDDYDFKEDSPKRSRNTRAVLDSKHLDFRLLDKDCEELWYNNNELAGATKRALILMILEVVTSPDLGFIKYIITSHQKFMSSGELMDQLITIYYNFDDDIELKEYAQGRIVKFLEKWLHVSFDDFRTMKLVESLNAIITDLSRSDLGNSTMWSTLLSKKWRNQMISTTQFNNTSSNPEGSPKPIITRKMRKTDKNGICLAIMDPLELARQFTIHNHQLFTLISGKELIYFDNPDFAPNLHNFSEHCEKCTNWIIHSILSSPSKKKCGKHITLSIQLAHHFMKLNNYMGFMAVMSALGHYTIERLKHSWRYVSNGHSTLYRSMEILISPLRNFSALREHMSRASPPFIYPPALFMRDLIMLDEQPNYFENVSGEMIELDRSVEPTDASFLNLFKFEKLGEIIDNLQKAQKEHYLLSTIPVIQNFVHALPNISEDDFEDLSCNIEQ